MSQPSLKQSSWSLCSVLLLLAGLLSSVSLPAQNTNNGGGVAGHLSYEAWTGIGGSRVSDLVNDPRFRQSPDISELIPGAENIVNADQFGSRLRGTITAPVTGTYVFWVSGDNGVEMWLSSDDRKWNRQLIAYHIGHTGLQQWDKSTLQKSAPVSLEAGQKYYVEALHKEDAGGSHVSMAWAYEAEGLVDYTAEPGVVATQKTVAFGGVASRAIDGDTNGDYWDRSTTHTSPSVQNNWWQVDLGVDQNIERIILYNRELCCLGRLSNFKVSVLDASGNELANAVYYTESGHVDRALTWDLDTAVVGRTVRVELLGYNLSGNGVLSLAEVRVMGRVLGSESENVAGAPVNLSLNHIAVASQSSDWAGGRASYAIDGNTNGNFGAKSTTHTHPNIQNNWWQVNLGADRKIDNVVLFNRSDVAQERLSNFKVSVLDASGGELASSVFHTESGHVDESLTWQLDTPVIGRTVRVELLGFNLTGNGVLSLAEVQVMGTEGDFAGRIQGRELIPVEALESFVYDIEDQDDDGLLDSWEQTYGFDTSTWQSGDFAYGADPDRDYISNVEECELGTDPFTPDSRHGLLSLEQRLDLAFTSVREAAQEADKIYQEADNAYFVDTSSTGVVRISNLSQRLRGYIVAPETGEYHFWVSSSDASQLLLSTGEGKFSKRIIAELGPEVGTGHGQTFGLPNRYDQFVSQMSEGIDLVAGQKYFIEVLHQHDHGPSPHASVAWARPNGVRESIPSEYLHSYHFVAEDADDDSLLDSWELQYGLSVTDNGLIDRAHEGENGDFDDDGVNNRAEYIAGTNPANPDTDGDGIPDGAELNSHGTNPLVSDAPDETLVSTLELTGFTSSNANWTFADGGLLADSFRSTISWDFTVPSDGAWIIQVDTRLRGTVYANETLDVNASIDGEFVGRYAIQYGASHTGIMRLLSPHITSGSHSLTLEVDNLVSRRIVQIDEISLRKPSGLDADNNGIPDWVEGKLANADYVTAHATTSYTSPFCLEGNARIRGSLLINGASPLAGKDGQHWFANLVLNEAQMTNYTVSFANGQQVNGAMLWKETNVIGSGDITLRKGDALRLTGMPAWDTPPENVIVTLSVNGNVMGSNFAANAPVAYTFGTAGTYTVRVDCTDGNQTAFQEITVTAREANMPDDTIVVENALGYMNLTDAQVARDLYFEAGKGLNMNELESIDSSNYRFRLLPSEGGQLGVISRLWAGGPILDVADVSSVTITDALQNNHDTITLSTEFPGYSILTTPMVVLNLPEGGYVVVSIFRAGATFLDGTTEKTYTNADLINGVVNLQFLLSSSFTGGYCHYVYVYDADGNLLSQR